MFNRNDPAGPVFVEKEDDNVDYLYGFTKFEQCAKDFTAAWIQALSIRHELPGWSDEVANCEAGRLGILAAEEFCRQMEERGKDAKP